MSDDLSDQRLKPASLGVSQIVFFVVAAAAPLGATVAGAPIVFSIAGRGAPGLYLIASVALLLFAVGFAAMSKHVISAGGFSEIIKRGLGVQAGHAAAGVALLAYLSMSIAIYAQFAAFGSDLLRTLFFVQFDWRVLAFLSVVAVGLLGYRDVDLSARILGVFIVLEIAILLLFDVAVILATPISELSLAGLRPSEVFVPGVGPALLFAFGCFVGFESTTIYGEEARDPTRTIPMATYAAIVAIGIFYSITTWCIGQAYSNSDVRALAAADQINFVFSVNTRYVGAWSTYVMQLLIVTSVFAVLLSFHNALCRYQFALARDGFLPRVLGRTHARFRSPSVASIILSITTICVLLCFALTDADPLREIYLWMSGVAVLGILVLQALASNAVIGFFRKHPDRRMWSGMIAPAVGGAALWIVVVLAIYNFHLLSGVTNGIGVALPWLVPLFALAGVVNGLRVRPDGMPSIGTVKTNAPAGALGD